MNDAVAKAWSAVHFSVLMGLMGLIRHCWDLLGNFTKC